jgi:hypothetical protein
MPPRGVLNGVHHNEQQRMFFYPWYPAMMLDIQTRNVIDFRAGKMSRGEAVVAAKLRERKCTYVKDSFDFGLRAGGLDVVVQRSSLSGLVSAPSDGV